MVFIMMKNLTFAIEWLQVVIFCLFCFKKPMPHLKRSQSSQELFKEIFVVQRPLLRTEVRPCHWSQKNGSLHNIEPYPIESSESGLFGLRIKIFNTEYAVMNVYCHCNLKLPFMQDQIKKFFSKDGLNVLRGDFN